MVVPERQPLPRDGHEHISIYFSKSPPEMPKTKLIGFLFVATLLIAISHVNTYTNFNPNN